MPILKFAVDKAFRRQIKQEVYENVHRLCDDEHIPIEKFANDIKVEECDATTA
jgi:hypothetical protein